MMTGFNRPATGGATRMAELQPMFRKPQRICATVPYAVHQYLQERADTEGRSVSNLISYIIEKAAVLG